MTKHKEDYLKLQEEMFKIHAQLESILEKMDVVWYKLDEEDIRDIEKDLPVTEKLSEDEIKALREGGAFSNDELDG